MLIDWRTEDNNVPGQTGDHRYSDLLILEDVSVTDRVSQPDDALYYDRDQLSSYRDGRDTLSDRSE